MNADQACAALGVSPSSVSMPATTQIITHRRFPADESGARRFLWIVRDPPEALDAMWVANDTPAETTARPKPKPAPQPARQTAKVVKLPPNYGRLTDLSGQRLLNLVDPVDGKLVLPPVKVRNPLRVRRVPGWQRVNQRLRRQNADLRTVIRALRDEIRAFKAQTPANPLIEQQLEIYQSCVEDALARTYIRCHRINCSSSEGIGDLMQALRRADVEARRLRTLAGMTVVGVRR